MNIIKTDDKRLDVIKEYLNAKFVYDYVDISSRDLILPIKGIDDIGNIIDSNLNLFKILDMKIVKRLFVSKETKLLNEIKENYGIEVISLMDYEDVLKMNSYLTAEGLLGIVIAKTDFCLKDKSVLLIGYGNCGKEIYDLFSKITDVKIDDFKNIEKYDIIINTVPKLILDKELLKRTKGIVFDISSFPHGIDFEYARELGVKYYVEPIIPARFSSKDAGIILAKKIFEICK